MTVLEPRFEFIMGTLRVRILEDWVFKLDECPPIIIPAGFECDFASVPRLLWPIASPMGILRYGSIPHDFGYQHGYLLTPNPNLFLPLPKAQDLINQSEGSFEKNVPVYIGESRKFFDDVFLKLTVNVTGARRRALGAYAMVRLCGWWAWRKYRKVGPIAFHSNSLHLPGAKEHVTT